MVFRQKECREKLKIICVAAQTLLKIENKTEFLSKRFNKRHKSLQKFNKNQSKCFVKYN